MNINATEWHIRSILDTDLHNKRILEGYTMELTTKEIKIKKLFDPLLFGIAERFGNAMDGRILDMEERMYESNVRK